MKLSLLMAIQSTLRSSPPERCRSALDCGYYPLAVEVLQLPAIDGMVVGEVEHGVIDALQSAADGAAKAYPDECAMGDDQHTAAAELLCQRFQRCQPAAGRPSPAGITARAADDCR